MTFSAKQTEQVRGYVTVHLTYGAITLDVSEPAAHLRYFWHQLGEAIDKAEYEEARREATGNGSVSVPL